MAALHKKVVSLNWDQHDVSSGECEQIFFNRPLIIKRDKEHSKNENRYYVLGRTNVNRLLFAVFTVPTSRCLRFSYLRELTLNCISNFSSAADQSALPLTKEQRKELDGRLAAYKADGVKGRIAKDVIADIRKRL